MFSAKTSRLELRLDKVYKYRYYDDLSSTDFKYHFLWVSELDGLL